MLESLRKRLEIDQHDEAAALEHQPGDFRASTVELDEIQRLLLEAGAVGASLTGAGMGGVVVGIVRRDLAESVREHLIKNYFLKARKHFSENHLSAFKDGNYPIYVVYPIAGVSYVHTP